MKQELTHFLFLAIFALSLGLFADAAHADATVNGFFRTNLVSEGIFERELREDETLSLFGREKVRRTLRSDSLLASPPSLERQDDSFDVGHQNAHSASVSELSPNQANGFAID